MNKDWLEFAIGRCVIGIAISVAAFSLIVVISIYQVSVGNPDPIPQNLPSCSGGLAAGLCGVVYAGVGRSTPSQSDVDTTVMCVLSWMLLETMVIAVIVLPLCI